MSEEKIRLEYSVAPIWRRSLALLVDLFLIVLSAFLMYGLSNMALNATPWFEGVNQTRMDIQAQSGLYVDGVSYTDYLEGSGMSTREKKDALSLVISSFYEDETFCDETALEGYEDRKREAVYSAYVLFTDVDGTMVEADVPPQYLYDFYVDEFELHTLGYLSVYAPYAETSRFYFWSSVIQVVTYATISVSVFWLIIPMWGFKRGRMSIGRKLYKIAILGKDAMVVSKSRFLYRFLFVYFVYLWLGFFSFLLPIFVSMGMQMLSRRQQDLAEYVLNQYSVDVRKQDVYMDYGDYEVSRPVKKTSLFDEEVYDPNAPR